MTEIAFQDGGVVFRDGKVGTGQACCCKKCSGPCDDSEDCAPGCACVDGECVEKCSGPCDSGDGDCDPECKCIEGQCIGECECASADGFIPEGGSLRDDCDTATFVEALEDAGYTNVSVQIIPEVINANLTIYRYVYSGTCCGRFGNDVLFSDGGCQWPAAGQNVRSCDTCENPLP